MPEYGLLAVTVAVRAADGRAFPGLSRRVLLDR
jgi:hypothetical protein